MEESCQSLVRSPTVSDLRGSRGIMAGAGL